MYAYKFGAAGVQTSETSRLIVLALRAAEPPPENRKTICWSTKATTTEAKQQARATTTTTTQRIIFDFGKRARSKKCVRVNWKKPTLLSSFELSQSDSFQFAKSEWGEDDFLKTHIF
jgi:hypothetical protein